MKTIAIIERGKDGSYGIYTPDLVSTIAGNGMSLEEAKKDFLLAYNEMLLAYKEDLKKEMPDELKDLEFVYKYDAACALEECSKYIKLTELAKEIGINASLLRQYKKGQYISAVQAKRIQVGINQIGMRIASFELA